MAKVNRYKLTGVVGVSCYTTVLAESEEDARNIAAGRDAALVGYATEEDAWIIEEGDGQPSINGCEVDEEDVEEEADEE